MALSLLTPLLVFFSINFFLLFHPSTPKKDTGKLEVRLAQPLPQKALPRQHIKLLTTPAPAPFKVAQSPVQHPPVIAPPLPTPVTEPAPPAAEKVTGITFPGSIASPFPGQARTSNPFSMQARGAQQEAARAYYQQAMEAQARQRAEFQAQLMLQQLQQLLAKLLDAEPAVSGRCVLAESGDNVNHGLKCDSSALYEVLYKEKRNIAGMLIALREMGRATTGFTVQARQNNSLISIY